MIFPSEIGLYMGESSKFPKSWTFESQILKLAVCLQISTISCLNGQLSLDKLKLNQRSHKNLPNSRFWGWLSVESQPQIPEFRNNPENFHPCLYPSHIALRRYAFSWRPYTISEKWKDHFGGRFLFLLLYNNELWRHVMSKKPFRDFLQFWEEVKYL